MLWRIRPARLFCASHPELPRVESARRQTLIPDASAIRIIHVRSKAMSTDTESRIEGDGYYALWRRNDRAWGHAMPVGVYAVMLHPRSSVPKRKQNGRRDRRLFRNEPEKQ